MSAPIPKHPPTTLLGPAAATAAWAPFRHRTFTVIWTATVVSNIGGWMYNVASGWLFTNLDPNPLTVSMVQVANHFSSAGSESRGACAAILRSRGGDEGASASVTTVSLP